MNARGCAVALLCLLLLGCEDDTTPTGTQAGSWPLVPVVFVQTSMGDFEIELYFSEAPVTTENFLRYVKNRYYDGLTFHRVIANFMIQGGGFDENMMQRGGTYPPIQNEAGNGLQNLRGTIAMARTSVPHSATSQFFINTRDNAFLDHRDDTPQGYGYAVFGRVRTGMDVVDAIENVPTGTKNGFNDVPLTPVVIEKMTYRRPAVE
jgi:cyclophilin family peptidyl-prolyl cis-trans isomerase